MRSESSSFDDPEREAPCLASGANLEDATSPRSKLKKMFAHTLASTTMTGKKFKSGSRDSIIITRHFLILCFILKNILYFL